MELKAFAKVELKPKQKKTVTFTLDHEAFWHFDTGRNAWNTESGEFEVWVGASSRDVREKRSVILEPAPRASRLHTGVPIKTLLADKEAAEILQRLTAGPVITNDIKQIEELSLEEVAAKYPQALPASKLMQIESELVKIK